MNKLNFYYFIFLIFYLPLNVEAQDNGSAAVSPLESALKIIQSTEYCSLITIDSQGRPRSRVMSPFPVDSTFIIRFGTHARSRKVAQIQSNPEVLVSYFKQDTREYVNVNGIATFIKEQSYKDKYWKEGWSSFYPNRESDYILIEVRPETLEIFSYQKGFFTNKFTLKPTRIAFDKND